MELRKRYRFLLLSVILSALPLAFMAILVLNGFGFDQMINSFGLVVDENSIMLFALIAFGTASGCLMSMLVLIYVYIRQAALNHMDRKIEENPDRADYYRDLKKIIE